MAGAGNKNKTATGLVCTRGCELLTRSPTDQQAHSDKETGTPLPKTAFPLRVMEVISLCIKQLSLVVNELCEFTTSSLHVSRNLGHETRGVPVIASALREAISRKVSQRHQET